MPPKVSTKTPVKPKVKEDPRFAQAVQNYEAALKALQMHKFERAKALFEKLLDGSSAQLADRARTHLSICNQHLVHTTTTFKSSEEHFDYCVSLVNRGDYDSARTHIEKLLKQSPKADFAIYLLAVLDCLEGKPEDSLRNLSQAIKLNPANRIQARNDTDFAPLADDPRFTELLYPEPEAELTSAAPVANKRR